MDAVTSPDGDAVERAGRAALDAYEAIPYDNDLTGEQVWALMGRAALAAAREPVTQDDRVAAVIDAIEHTIDQNVEGPNGAQFYRVLGERILSARGGRILAARPSAPTVTDEEVVEWGVRWPDTGLVEFGDDEKEARAHAARAAMCTDGSALVSRTVRTSPWREVRP